MIALICFCLTLCALALRRTSATPAYFASARLERECLEETPHAASLLPSEHAAPEVENAGVVCFEPDDGPRARRCRAEGQDTRSQARYSLSRGLQQKRQNHLYRP